MDEGWEQEPPADDEPDADEDDGPSLIAIEGGGRGPGRGQQPLLLTVHGTGPATVSDHRQLAADLSALYGARVAVRDAAVIAVTVLDALVDQHPADPHAYVLAAVEAAPDHYRPAVPIPSPRRRRASGTT